MSRYDKRLLILTTLVCILPMVYGAIVYEQLPTTLPIHWNYQGEVNQYASKGLVVFGLPLLMVGVQWFCFFMFCKDLKKTNKTSQLYKGILWVIPVISVVIQGMTYLYVSGMNIDMELWIPSIVGMVFIFVGLYLPKLPQNDTMGIKLPWTLNDEDNWRLTHRMGGFLMVLSGVIIIVLSHFHQALIGIVVAIILSVIIPCVYSYWLNRSWYKDED